MTPRKYTAEKKEKVIFAADKTPAASRMLTIQVTNELSIRYELIYVTSDEQMPTLTAWAEKQKAMGVDIETDGLEQRGGHIATIQIGNPFGDNPRAYVIDARSVSPQALEPLFQVFRSKNCIKYGQNLKFECKWLQEHYGVHMRNLRDTQLNELVLRAGLFDSKNNYAASGERAAYKWCSMGELGLRYLGISLDKDHDLRTSFYHTPPGRHTERQLAYAAGDVIYPFYIWKYQKIVAEQRKLLGILKVEWNLIPILANAENRGIGIDTASWRALWQESVKLSAQTVRALDDLFRPITLQQDLFDGILGTNARPIYPKKNEPLNYSSSEHKLWAIKAYCESIGWKQEIVIAPARALELKKEYGEEWLEYNKSQGRKVEVGNVPERLVPEDKFCILLDTDKKTLLLRMLRGQLPSNIVRLLTDYSKYEKRATAFGIQFLKKYVDEDGRLRTEIHQCVTNTGRMSTTPNTQNWPADKRYRACAVPAKGYKYVIADYSQIEPRISAQVSNDPTYIAAFALADDIYLSVAENMFGFRPDKKTPEGALLRQIAKIIVLALAYRMGPDKLRNQLTLGLAEYIERGEREAPTYQEALDLWKKFFEACPGIQEYQNECSELAHPQNTKREKLWDDFLGKEVTYIQAPCGRIRFFPPDALTTYTEAPNAPIQGGSATIMKAAIVLIQDEIDERGWDAHLVNAVHDEAVYEVEEPIAHEFAGMMKERMEFAASFYIPNVPCIAEYPENTSGVVPFWTKGFNKPEEAEAAGVPRREDEAA